MFICWAIHFVFPCCEAVLRPRWRHRAGNEILHRYVEVICDLVQTFRFDRLGTCQGAITVAEFYLQLTERCVVLKTQLTDGFELFVFHVAVIPLSIKDRKSTRLNSSHSV